MLFIRVILLLVLAAIFVQDIKSRSVYWFWFPALAILLVIVQHNQKTYQEILESTAINCGFILLQLLLVSLYFSVKNKGWVNITNELLGWGDVLFLFSISFYLSTLNYILFYILSLITILILWLITTILFQKKDKQIPLAGLQSLIFIVCLILDWNINLIGLTHDDWLLHYLV